MIKTPHGGWKTKINRHCEKQVNKKEEKRKAHKRAGGENRRRRNYEMKNPGYMREVMNGEYSLFLEKGENGEALTHPTRSPSNMAE